MSMIMTHDGLHGLDISYNHLNLIESISRNDTVLVNYSYLQPFDITFGRHFLYKCKLVCRFQKDYGIKPGTFNWSS